MKNARDLSKTTPSLDVPGLQGVFVEVRAELLRFLTRRTGNTATASDISHDVFEKTYCVDAPIPDAKHARSYLFRMADNMAIDRRRSEARRADILSGAEVLFDEVEISPEQIAISRDRLARFERALDELPPNVREVLVLARVKGMAQKEIAQHLGISLSLVEKYLFRALKHCRARLDAGD